MKKLDGEMSITQNLFDVIIKLFPPKTHPNILEIGSGIGTAFWVEEGYKVTAVEHDPQWVGSVKGADYHYAPLSDLYYNKEMLLNLLKEKNDIWIIDGPPGMISDRTKILELLRDKFFDLKENYPKVIIVDDCQREDGNSIAFNIWRKFRGIEVFEVHNQAYGGSPHTAKVLML